MSGTSANKGFYAGCNPMVFKKAGPQPGLLDKSKAAVTPIKPACPSDSYVKGIALCPHPGSEAYGIAMGNIDSSAQSRKSFICRPVVPEDAGKAKRRAVAGKRTPAVRYRTGPALFDRTGPLLCPFRGGTPRLAPDLLYIYRTNQTHRKIPATIP